jgi:hypothetical protein
LNWVTTRYLSLLKAGLEHKLITLGNTLATPERGRKKARMITSAYVGLLKFQQNWNKRYEWELQIRLIHVLDCVYVYVCLCGSFQCNNLYLLHSSLSSPIWTSSQLQLNFSHLQRICGNRLHRIWGSHSGDYEEYFFWDVTPCSPLKVKQRFEGTYSLHLQGRLSRARYQSRKRWPMFWRCCVTQDYWVLHFSHCPVF